MPVIVMQRKHYHSRHIIKVDKENPGVSFPLNNAGSFITGPVKGHREEQSK
jgi:hypothetical protein